MSYSLTERFQWKVLSMLLVFNEFLEHYMIKNCGASFWLLAVVKHTDILLSTNKTSYVIEIIEFY